MAIIRANNNTLSSVTALPSAISTGSNIIEVINSICDGRSITVPSGTYTMPNVTAQQELTTSWADVTGSSFTYTLQVMLQRLYIIYKLWYTELMIIL